MMESEERAQYALFAVRLLERCVTMRKMTLVAIAAVVVAALLPGQVMCEGGSGEQVFYRMLGSETNAPLLPKTRTVCACEGEERTRSTGMADSGFTEYPFCSGKASYTFAENYAYFPRIASDLPVAPGRVNTGDILIDHVYEPDGCVWGWSAKEFIQTFTATGRELVSVTLLVASEPGVFRAALLEGGPAGRQVGPARTFHSGHSMETGVARWKAEEAMLASGATYAIRLWREDGQPWKPYLHSTGNVYGGGLLYVDGVARPESDLAAWIIEEPADLSRAVVEDTDGDGWVYDAAGVVFLPRTPNVRLISVAIAPAERRICDMVLRVKTTEESPRVLAGPKRCVSGADREGVQRAHFLFASDELKVVLGDRYCIEVFTIPYKSPLPDPKDIEILQRDIQARVYGEPQPGALPAIGNLTSRFDEENDLQLSWVTSFPCPVQAEARRVGSSDREVFDVDAGAKELAIPKPWPGHDYDFWLRTVGPTGLVWKTPVYRVRVPKGPHPPPPPYLYPDHPEAFVKLAPPPLPKPPEWGVLRFRDEVAVANPDFEDGLQGWTADPEGIVYAAGEEHGISPPIGRKMAGWSNVAGEKRDQVFEESVLYQRVATKPGHHYILSARVHTSVAKGLPRGDTRVRLFADPEGQMDWGDRNSSQWYWTDGRWLRFQHRWVAAGDVSTIGFGFFRWRDLERASAYVDHVRVFDLGPAAKTPLDPPAQGKGIRTIVLSAPRSEATERTEAELSAPPGHVITGIGARAAGDNVTTMRIRVSPLLPDGRLGEPEEMLAGWEADAGLEANIDLPEGFVATGFGARIAPEWDVKTFAVWGRPLLPDGTLGEEKEFRAGIEPNGGLERRVRLEGNRVLISAGLRCSFNDVAGINARSAELHRTATARKRSE